MARPTDVSDFGEAVYAQLAPVADQDESNNWALLIYVAAFGEMFKDMDILAHADPSWSILLDPDNIPAEGLPWLGQIVGVSIDVNFTEAQQRQQIKDRIGFNRGTLNGIKKAIAPYLTGTKTVVIIERDTSNWHFAVRTYSSETPPGLTYQDLYNNYATYQAFYNSFASYEGYWLTDPREVIKLKIAETKPAGDQFTYSVLPGSPP